MGCLVLDKSTGKSLWLTPLSGLEWVGVGAVWGCALVCLVDSNGKQ
jgi:hypothetical protein